MPNTVLCVGDGKVWNIDLISLVEELRASCRTQTRKRNYNVVEKFNDGGSTRDCEMSEASGGPMKEMAKLRPG